MPKNIKKEIRRKFRDDTLSRDNNACRTCGTTEFKLDVHHISSRRDMPNGGYVKENGISLCPDCHEKAEEFYKTGTLLYGFGPDDLYKLIGSSYEEAVKSSKVT